MKYNHDTAGIIWTNMFIVKVNMYTTRRSSIQIRHTCAFRVQDNSISYNAICIYELVSDLVYTWTTNSAHPISRHTIGIK